MNKLSFIILVQGLWEGKLKVQRRMVPENSRTVNCFAPEALPQMITMTYSIKKQVNPYQGTEF